MEPMLIVLFAFVGLLIAMIIGVCIAYCYTKSNKQQTSARSPRTVQTEEISGPPISGTGPTTSFHQDSKSAEKINMSPSFCSPKDHLKSRSGSGSAEKTMMSKLTMRSKSNTSLPDQSMEKGRLKMKHFKFNGFSKKLTRLPEGPLMHTYSNVPRNHSLVPRILLKEIRGDITMYAPDFSVNLPLLSGTRRRNEILEYYYHLGQPVLDNDDYGRRRRASQTIPEPTQIEGNHERVKRNIEGTPFLDMIPYLSKMPAKRDDTTRHFILNTQYASRIAIRFRCDSGRYNSIPTHDIIEPCGRLRVVIVANADMDDQPEKEAVYYEYIQVPERAMDAQQEFMKRPVIGKITLRLFPNALNLSPNTFYPSSRRRTPLYMSTLTNSGKSPCKFVWPENNDVIVSPQNGFIKPQSSVQFTFTLKRPATTCAIIAEMKYNLNDKPSAIGSILARFETADVKRSIQVATKALAACDTAEDPGYFPG